MSQTAEYRRKMGKRWSGEMRGGEETFRETFRKRYSDSISRGWKRNILSAATTSQLTKIFHMHTISFDRSQSYQRRYYLSPFDGKY
jgi:hypothetical protein